MEPPKTICSFGLRRALWEAVLSVTQNAKGGLQNAARREPRFLLEAAVKLSARDLDLRRRHSKRDLKVWTTAKSDLKITCASYPTSVSL
jgi:hypothetical protein